LRVSSHCRARAEITDYQFHIIVCGERSARLGQARAGNFARLLVRRFVLPIPGILGCLLTRLPNTQFNIADFSALTRPIVYFGPSVDTSVRSMNRGNLIDKLQRPYDAF
jgi:hypothetical protein